ncbi:hypothetical protein ACK8P5_25815 (plasmid) [Paenibacillus sp. EC2-1]|uniref:hypothetical protein n=1 Tax=Paenibacillus sp. EC2-1 TaxID=3388665 RepID=UPI003BEEF8B6
MSVTSYVMKNMKGMGGVSAMAAIGAGVDGVTTYMGRRSEHPDESTTTSAAIAAGTAAAWLVAEPLMWGITLAGAASTLGREFIDEGRENRLDKAANASRVTNEKGVNTGTLGGRFHDSQQAATMRQRQMDMMRQHRLATETILGSEARQLHR